MLLALVRMILFAAVTLKEAAGLIASRLLNESSYDDSMRRGHLWGKRLTAILGLRIETSGSLPEGPAIFVANHRSYADVPALLSLSPSFFLGKIEIASWPLLGRAARDSGTILVKRDERESRREVKHEIARRVAEGHRVTVFSEGTTSRGPGILPFRPGVFHLAAQRGLTIVPLALSYDSPEDAWVDDDSLFRHFFDRFRRPVTRLRIAVGPPLRGEDGGDLHAAAHDWISENLKRPLTVERRPVCAVNPATATSFSAALPVS